MMRRIGGGVQFFDLVEVDWRSEHGVAATAETSSGCTGGATVATCTAEMVVDVKDVGAQPGERGVSTGRAMRDGKTIGINSRPRGLAVGQNAWGIMVPGI
ncbi:MAG: hypothetical protein SF187_02335 [Deltaproteobacteria bacterium]|nr:hypothetical protein [Deltaproteobacteria bacterium]